MLRSRIQNIQQPYAIVIGLDCITGLQTARILAGRNVPVIGIAKNPKHFCCRTRICKEILFADTSGDEFINKLTTLGPELQQKAILFPCTDISVLFISRYRKKLEGWYHVVLPEPDVVEMLIDKLRFYTYAQEKGFPVPHTFFLNTRADAEQAVGKLTFPCVLKPPIKTPTWEKHTKAKVFKVSNVEEFLSRYDRCSTWTEALIAQEWIEGSDANLYTCNCYFNADSKPIVTFISRKLRQWPPEKGVGCLSEECRNDIVLHETIRLFQSVRYRGLGYLEMKRDERTGKYFITEPNIGRPTGRSAIAEAGGVELLYTMYCDTVGLPLPPNLEQKYKGTKWIYFTRDLQSALHYWRRGDLTLRELWWSWRGRKTYALFSWTDPAPFWGDLREYMSRVFGFRSGIARLILRKAVSLIRHLFWLCFGFIGALMHRRAMSPVIAHYGKTPPIIGPRSHLVVRLDTLDGSRPLMVRFYKPERSLDGLRHTCVKAVVRRQGIDAPGTIGQGYLRLDGRPYFAVVEEVVSGQHLRAWTEQLAFALGQDLARWHRVRIPHPIALVVGIRRWGPEVYQRAAKERFHRLKPYDELLHVELYRAIQALESEDFRGPYAFSHGDLQAHNVLVSPDGRLIWLDFDLACRRPRRHDLAAVEFVILRKFPEVIDAFESGYFDIHPDDQAGWRKYRLGWYRICCLREALKQLTLHKPSFIRAQEYLTLSSTCQEVSDVGQPASSFVENILRRAKCKMKSWQN